jgi:hypothetical protein
MKKIKAALHPAQTKLVSGVSLNLTDKRGDTPPFVFDEKNNVMCPFCLHIGHQKDFLMYKDDKPITYRVKCPECEQTFLMKTLMADMSVVEFADWVAEYARSGFWTKCSFEKFTARLKLLGWSKTFWERYRAMTGGGYKQERYERVIRSAGEDALDSRRYRRE